MRRTWRGPLLLAGTALALLPLAPAARAAELGGDESCSRADAHASQRHAGPSTHLETAEAALAVEVTRPLPTLGAEGALGTGGADVRGTAPASARVAITTLPRETADGMPGSAFVAPRVPDAWTPPPETPVVGLLHVRDRTVPMGESTPTPLGFRDSAAPRERIRDLRRLRELKLLRVFDTSSMMVWLGLDRKGRPGLHFRQRNPDEAMPAAVQSAFLLDPPPLRSVPLTSP